MEDEPSLRAGELVVRVQFPVKDVGIARFEVKTNNYDDVKDFLQYLSGIEKETDPMKAFDPFNLQHSPPTPLEAPDPPKSEEDRAYS